jgi:phosphoribosyl-AMP cyclohydrolase
LNDLDFKKGGSLIPVIVQDTKTLEVLTLAYVNQMALVKTLKTGYAHFFRRSFKKVMKKGETSGNIQTVKQILVDCDHDAILYLVERAGPACHLGKETCFHNELKIKNEKTGTQQ